MNINLCPLCSNKKLNLKWNINNCKIVICSNCFFIFVKKYHKKRNYINFDYKNAALEEKIIRNDAKRSIDIVKKYTIGSNNLLDIGCGRGYFIDEAIKKGFICTGIDYSEKVISFANRQLKLNVSRKDILNFNSKNKYSIIILNQVIEHFSDPYKLLLKCIKALENDGIIYIATPNIKSINAIIKKDQFDHLIPPEHLSYFSPETIKLLCSKLNLKILYLKTWSYPRDLAGIIKYIFKKEKININNIESINSNSKKVDLYKNFKYLLFDNFFCNLFYRLLNINNYGTNLEIICKKFV